MKKRLICLVLTLCMAFSVFSASAFATLIDGETVETSAAVEPAPEATPAVVPSEPLPTPAAPQVSEPICNCESACADGAMNPACPVCGAEGATADKCAKYAPAPATLALTPPQDTPAATEQPTPTPADTESPAPAVTPTVEPTETPAVTPAVTPTAAPTETPSDEPTPSPADEPDTTPAPVPGTLEYVQSLIDALPDPDSVTEENREDIMSQLDAIDEARLALPDDADIDTLDFTKYELLCTALGEDHTPETLETSKTLQEIINEDTTGTVTLDKNYDISSTITINKTLTLDLAGHTITYIGSTGSVIKVESGGNLTLKDSGSGGKITGGKGSTSSGNVTNGGGVYVDNGGSFTMQSGTITGCSATHGGGVCVDTNGSFSMQGGIITGCSATLGGGVNACSSSTFTMTGGEIGNNTSNKEGKSNAIYADGMHPNGGTVSDTVTFASDVNSSNGGSTTFKGKVYNNSSIYGGTYNGEVECTGSGNTSTIYGGTFNGTVILNAQSGYTGGAYIRGGTFNGLIELRGNEQIRWKNNDNGIKELHINAGFTYGLGAFEHDDNEIKENIKNSWSILHEIFDADGGTPTTQTLTFVNATSQPDKNKVSFPISDPTKEGHAFVGWYKDNTKYDYYTTSHAASGNGVHEVTYKAKWTADSYNIVYDPDGGTNATTNPATYTYGVGVASFAAPTRTGYVFKGWVDVEGKTVTSISETQTGEVTLKAQWERASYTLSFNSNGGTDVAPTVGVHGTVIDLTQAKYRPTRYGYIFTGWYTDAKLTTRVASLTLTENTTLVAGWTLNTWVGPHTGDDSNIALYAALMGGSLLLIAAAAVVIIKKKKRK